MIRTHAADHPRLEAQDCYKFILQAILGTEHAAPSEDAALAWLEREIAGLDPNPEQVMVEPITPDGSLVRVHLRPFMAMGGDTRKLARAFVETGRRKRGTRAELAEQWQRLVSWTQRGGLPFTSREAGLFGEKMAAAGWPAVRHSLTFTEAYNPAYRVVASDLLRDVLPEDQ